MLHATFFCRQLKLTATSATGTTSGRLDLLGRPRLTAFANRGGL
jgi:hypothetical protein